jgi:hypothetical protein
MVRIYEIFVDGKTFADDLELAQKEIAASEAIKAANQDVPK